MPNPGTVSQGDIDKLEQGMKDLTSLSQQLSKTFRDINKETDVLSNNFKNIVRQAGLNNNNAERYLISQKLQEATQNRINEIKRDYIGSKEKAWLKYSPHLTLNENNQPFFHTYIIDTGKDLKSIKWLTESNKLLRDQLISLELFP